MTDLLTFLRALCQLDSLCTVCVYPKPNLEPNRTWNQTELAEAGTKGGSQKQRVSCGGAPVACGQACPAALWLCGCGPVADCAGSSVARDCHGSSIFTRFDCDYVGYTSVRCRPCRSYTRGNTTARRTPDPQSAMKSNRPAAPLRGPVHSASNRRRSAIARRRALS